VAAQQPPTTECNAVPKKTVQKRTEKNLYFNTGTGDIAGARNAPASSQRPTSTSPRALP